MSGQQFSIASLVHITIECSLLTLSPCSRNSALAGIFEPIGYEAHVSDTCMEYYFDELAKYYSIITFVVCLGKPFVSCPFESFGLVPGSSFQIVCQTGFFQIIPIISNADGQR